MRKRRRRRRRKRRGERRELPSVPGSKAVAAGRSRLVTGKSLAENSSMSRTLMRRRMQRRVLRKRWRSYCH